jgi:GT2 family glycosyltransferase
MRVGLVIVTYNAETSIRRALDAVAAQTRLPDRLVILDNQSRDQTCAAIRSAIDGWPIPVRLVDAGANIGFAAGNNRAVALLDDCELVALLNPDAFPEPEWLERLVDAAAAHPEAASFASRQMIAGRAGHLDGAGDVCHVSGVVWRDGHGLPLAAVPTAGSSHRVFSACGAAALYRLEDWRRAGGFDERFFCYAEDVDLGFRLQLAGRDCWYVADAVVHHVGSASAGVGSAFAVYHGHRNIEWMFLKNMPTPVLWRYLPLHLATWAAGLMRFAMRGRGGDYLRAKRDAIRGIGDARRARVQVQATCVRSNQEVLRLLDRRSLVGRLRSSSAP